MQWFEDAWMRSDLPRPAVATIGNYDGVHRGQQEILNRIVERARTLDAPATVVTFDPHPLTVVAPDRAPRRLDAPAQKRAALERAGVDAVLEVRFDRRVAETTAEDFVRGFLHERLGVLEVHVGSRFAFGRGQQGDLDLLRRLGRDLGFEAHGVPEVGYDGAPISSSRIRNSIIGGAVEEARAMLGRAFALRGRIVPGARRGSGMGFPTINLAPEQDLIPARGVYVSEVRFAGQSKVLPAVTNVGVRPTLTPGVEVMVESHILDFSGDVYGETVELGFLERLRDELAFDGVEALKEQIQRDVQRARSYFRHRSDMG
jgi:riboflavin kinase / FMN adenylyltransferase